MEAATHFERAAALHPAPVGKPHFAGNAVWCAAAATGSGILEEKGRREPVKYCIGERRTLIKFVAKAHGAPQPRFAPSGVFGHPCPRAVIHRLVG